MAAIHTAGSNSVLDFWIALSPHVRITMIVVAALAVFLTAIH
jgi:hypothetical protein